MNETLLPELSPRIETLALIRMAARLMQRTNCDTKNISKA